MVSQGGGRICAGRVIFILGLCIWQLTNASRGTLRQQASLAVSAPPKLNVSVLLKKSTISDMNTISIATILELPIQERIRLVELIWDSVAAFPEAVEISPALKAELEVRLAEFEANPEAGYSWEQVKSRLKDGSWRSA